MKSHGTPLSTRSLTNTHQRRGFTKHSKASHRKHIIAFILFLSVVAAGVSSLKTRHVSAATQSVVLDSNFETGDATVWTTAPNTGTNIWFVGTATAAGGTKSAYITNDAGVSNAYTVTTSVTANHIYTPVTFPAGETAIVLSFDWKGVAEHSIDNNTGSGTSFDHFRVSLTAAPPVAGTYPVVADQIPIIFNAQLNFTRAYVVLPASAAGTTKNLVFTWRDDTSGGSTAPAIDNVRIVTQTPVPLSGTRTIQPSGGDYSSFAAAIADLSANGASASGVTYNVAAGSTYNETPPPLTATGTAGNPIIFQKSGAGANPLVTATGTGNWGPTGTGSVASSDDSVFIISGGDFITFDGIDVAGGNLVGTTTTTTAIDHGFMVRNASATDGAQNVTIKNSSLTLNRNNTATIALFQSSTATGGGVIPTAASGTNSNNKYYDLTIQSTFKGVDLQGGSTTNMDTANEIGGVNSTFTVGAATANNIGLSTSTTATWGIRANVQSGVKVFNTEVRNITTSGVIDGIFLDAVLGTSEAFKNKVHDLRNNSTTSTSAVSGMKINVNATGAANATRVYNNFVWGITSGYTGVASATRQMKGIFVQSAGGGAATQTHNIDFNSVRMDGSGSPTISSTAFEIGTSSGPVMNVRDNILANFTGAQTGIAKHYTWMTTSTTLIGPAGSTSNRNVLYIANSTNGFIGLTNATDRASLSDWQGAVSQDANSFAQDPKFMSPTDLHIQTGIATPVESNGSYFGGAITWVPVDIDMETRNATTPDIGADEGTFTALLANDIAANTLIVPASNGVLATGTMVSPQASFTNAGTVAQSNVMVQFTITGPGGYSYTDTQTIATINPSQTVTVTFAPAPAFTTPGMYSMAATVLTADGNAANNQVAGTFTVATPLSGNYNVGAGGDFTSLTNPGGLFAFINAVGMTNNVVVTITSDLTSETGTVALNQFAGGFTLTIQPSGARTISGSNTNALINLNGADGVNLNGLNTGGNSLTIRNTNSAPTTTILLINDASNDTVQNCTVEGGGLSGVVLVSTGTTTGNDNDVISGNVVRDRTDAAGVPFNGIISAGTSAAVANSNLMITNNQATNFSQAGILIFAGTENFTITGNNISQTASRASNLFCLGVQSGFGTNLISQNLVHDVIASSTFATRAIFLADARGTTVSRNRVYNIPSVAGATGVIAGIEFDGASGTAAAVTVVNNMVSIVPAVSTNQDIRGIFDFAFGGNTFTADYNSIYIGGTSSGTAASWALVRGISAPTTYTARNNIAFNNRTGGGANHFAGGDQSANTGTFVSNFNFFVGTGTTAVNFMDKGTSSTGTAVSYASWQAGPPARDANSFGGVASGFNPSNIFVNQNAGDLHLQATAPSQIMNAGTPIAVTTDFDNDTRNGTTPDIGADEFVSSLAIADASNVEGDSGMHNVSVTVTLNAAVNQTVTANWATASGTATAGADFVQSNGVVTFDPNQTVQTIMVPIIGDIIDEANENFFVNLTSPSNAGISDATSIVTIIDDDINSGDFDGDGKNDASVFRANADGAHVAKWYILHSGSNLVSGGVSFTELQFGLETDIPAAGDYDGNGTKDVAVYRPDDDGMGHSAFYVSHGSPQSFDKYVWGLSTDKPVPADYDGDLKTDIAVFRPSEGNWYIRKSSDGSLLVIQWGLSTDRLVPADYDADGKADVAVYRSDDPILGSGTWYIRRSSDGGLQVTQWGLSSDKVVPADYDVDGKADIAVWRPTDGTWYIRRSSDGSLQATTFGVMGDLPVPGDYDGDSKADIAVWRPTDGTYYYIRSSDGSISFGPQWGVNGDVPVAARYVPEQ